MFSSFSSWLKFCLAGALCAGVLAAAPQASDPTGVEASSSGIEWGSLLTQSLFFSGVEQGFRIATESYTRQALKGKFFDDWGRSIGNLHGWSDGDPFLTNYVGHPMQGSVSAFIFVHNDPKYRQLEFGRNRDYWKSRLRATLFSFAYSEQFELGPLSEASLGNAQQFYPQQGLVDHVITPTVGLLWMVGEDALDRYLIEHAETHVQNRWFRIVLRSGLNPSRSMANAMRLQVPWARDSRPGIFRPTAFAATVARSRALADARPLAFAFRGGSGVLPNSERAKRQPPLSDLIPGLTPAFELSANYGFNQLALGKPGSLACNGGGADATYNFSSWFGATVEVAGCKMLSPGVNLSGDVTNYLLGPRFAYRHWSRWTIFGQALVGGAKLTTETFYPDRVPANLPVVPPGQPDPYHSLYTSQQQTNGFSIEIGGGFDYIVNRVFAVRALDVNDVHTWARSLNDSHYPNNLRIGTGIVLRFGNW